MMSFMVGETLVQSERVKLNKLQLLDSFLNFMCREIAQILIFFS